PELARRHDLRGPVGPRHLHERVRELRLVLALGHGDRLPVAERQLHLLVARVLTHAIPSDYSLPPAGEGRGEGMDPSLSGLVSAHLANPTRASGRTMRGRAEHTAGGSPRMGARRGGRACTFP